MMGVWIDGHQWNGKAGRLHASSLRVRRVEVSLRIESVLGVQPKHQAVHHPALSIHPFGGKPGEKIIAVGRCHYVRYHQDTEIVMQHELIYRDRQQDFHELSVRPECAYTTEVWFLGSRIVIVFGRQSVSLDR